MRVLCATFVSSLALIACGSSEPSRKSDESPQTQSGGSAGSPEVAGAGGSVSGASGQVGGATGLAGAGAGGVGGSSGGAGNLAGSGGASEPTCSSPTLAFERGTLDTVGTSKAPSFGIVNNATNALSFVWTRERSISLSTQLENGSFVTRRPLSIDSTDLRARAVISGNGRAFVGVGDNTKVRLASAESAASESWKEATFSNAYPTNVALASNADNRTIAAWTRTDEEQTNHVVWAEYLPETDTWSEPRVVSEIGEAYSVSDLIADKNGDFHVAFFDRELKLLRLPKSANDFEPAEVIEDASSTGRFSIASDGTLVAAFHTDDAALVTFFDYETNKWLAAERLHTGAQPGQWISQVIAVPGKAFVAAPVETSLNANRVGIWQVEPKAPASELAIPAAHWAPSTDATFEDIRLGPDGAGGLLVFHMTYAGALSRPLWIHHYDSCAQAFREPVISTSRVFNPGPSGSLPDGRTWFAYDAEISARFPRYVVVDPNKETKLKPATYETCRASCQHMSSAGDCAPSVARCIEDCGNRAGLTALECTQTFEAKHDCEAKAEWQCNGALLITDQCTAEQAALVECYESAN